MDFSQFKKAISRFEEMLNAFKDEAAKRSQLEQDAIQDSLIKRFEYTLEIAWKSCKRHLHEEEGLVDAAGGSPKSIMRLAGESGFIRSTENWIRYIDARQSTSHDYSGEKADQVLVVVKDFYEDVIGLYQTLSGESWE